MSTIIYLLVSLLTVVISFYVLFSSKYVEHKVIRTLSWIAFYVNFSVIALIWLSFFFPGIYIGQTLISIHPDLIILARICLVSWIALGFFLWIYLAHKHSEVSVDRITRLVSLLASVAFLVSILIVSVTTLVLNL